MYEVKEGGKLRGEVIKMMQSKKYFTTCRLAVGGFTQSKLCKDKMCNRVKTAFTLENKDDVEYLVPKCSLMVETGS